MLDLVREKSFAGLLCIRLSKRAHQIFESRDPLKSFNQFQPEFREKLSSNPTHTVSNIKMGLIQFQSLLVAYTPANFTKGFQSSEFVFN